MIFLDVEIWEVVYFFRIRFLQHLRTKQQQKCTKVEKWSQGNSRNKWGHSSSSIYYFQGISDHNSSSKRSKNTPKNYIWYVVHIIMQNITWRVNFYSSKGLIWKGGKNILGVKKRCRDLVTNAYIYLLHIGWKCSNSYFHNLPRLDILFVFSISLSLPQNLKKTQNSSQ